MTYPWNTAPLLEDGGTGEEGTEPDVDFDQPDTLHLLHLDPEAAPLCLDW